jgi:hypothetical protein
MENLEGKSTYLRRRMINPVSDQPGESLTNGQGKGGEPRRQHGHYYAPLVTFCKDNRRSFL